MPAKPTPFVWATQPSDAQPPPPGHGVDETRQVADDSPPPAHARDPIPGVICGGGIFGTTGGHPYQCTGDETI